MSTGLSHEPDCWHCPHSAHFFGCESCDCPTSSVGACWNHKEDMTDDP